MINPPITKVTKVVPKMYQPSVYMAVDSDSGPNDVREVSSVFEFEILFNSFNKTNSYKMALWLLELGYKLYVKRVKLNNNFTSVRIYDDSVGYPVKDKSYNYINNEGELDLGELGVYSQRFTFTKNLENGDYLFLHDSLKWNLIWFGNEGDIPPVPIEVYYHSYRISGVDHSDRLNKLLLAIKYRLGYYISQIGTEILITMHRQFLAPHSNCVTFSYSILDDYDMKCCVNENLKRLEFYSKYDSNISDTEIIINQFFSNYNIDIIKYRDDGSVIKQESFTISLDISSENYIETVINNESELVDCKFYNQGSLSGNYKLGRDEVIRSNPTLTDYYNTVDDTLSDLNVDFIIDSGVVNFNYYMLLYDTFDISKKTNVFLFNVISSSESDLPKSFTSYFYKNIKYKGTEYPSYMAFLYLMSMGRFEGRFVDEMELIDEADLDLEYITFNYPETDGYGLELNNPLGYLSIGNLVPLSSIVAYTFLNNNIVNNIDVSNLDTRYQVNNFINLKKSEIREFLYYEFDAELTDFKRTERNLILYISYYVGINKNKKYELIININIS